MKPDHPNLLIPALLAARLARGRVLDCPAGEGRLARALADAGYDVEAGDLEGYGFTDPRIPWRAVDLNGVLPWEDERFDAVVSVEGIEHLENPFQAARELARVLKWEGLLFLSLPNYVNVEKRVRFLLTGWLSTPKPDNTLPAPVGPGERPRAHGHVLGLTYPALRYLLHAAGFEILARVPASRKRKIRLWIPVVGLIKFVQFLSGAERRRRGHQAELLEPAMLYGGRHLVVVARKVAG